MSGEKGLPKTETVLNYLHDCYRKGSFPDGRLPKELELCEMLGVSRVTVRRALAIMENSNLIVRRKRAGTFYRHSKHLSTNTAGLLMRTHGHLYGDLYAYLTEKLSQKGFSCKVVNYPDRLNLSKYKAFQRQAVQLINQPLDCLIAEGLIAGELPPGSGLQSASPIFWDFFDSPRQINYSGVWFNYEKAAYLAAKYLLKCGCKRPLLLLHPIPLEVRFNPINYQKHRQKQTIDGFIRAMAEYGLDGNDHVLGSNFQGNVEFDNWIIRIMQNPQLRPDAFLGAADSLLLRPMKEALHLKLKIPEELRFVGIGNTPWSRGDSIMPFSSVDLQLEKTAEKIVEQAYLKANERKEIFIEPKLIIRN